MKITIGVFLVCFVFVSCNVDQPVDEGLLLNNDSLLLPEHMVVKDIESGMSAQYIYPTTRYDHGILGDEIEGGGLLINFKKKQHFFKIDSFFVFEDIQPRLVDFDKDGVPEIVTILTHIEQGASVTIFQFNDGIISTFAASRYIGQTHRWLNIAAIDDLDNDGTIEIAYVTTPHIGGHLHIDHVEGNQLKGIAEQSGVSNHKIFSRNLCLSTITVSNSVKTLYLPNNEFDAILGFQWRNEKLIPVDTISFIVDPLVSLSEQYNFEGLKKDAFCINAE